VDWPVAPLPDLAKWLRATERTRLSYVDEDEVVQISDGSITEAFLLGALALEEQGELPSIQRLIRWSIIESPRDFAEFPGQRRELVRKGLIEDIDPDHFRTTESGRTWLGLVPTTGAVRESALHRALLLETFRIFARHGMRLEIVTQGSFSSRLPDARFNLLEVSRNSSPEELAAQIGRWQRHWAWHYFQGKNVHIEAEVSGALRPDRIERGIRKARDSSAHVVFGVPDQRRARRVRSTIVNLGADRKDASVWTLGSIGRAFIESTDEGRATRSQGATMSMTNAGSTSHFARF
jgi:hypothetical protein